ncbi:MAG TPA: hypothetical protein VED59_01510 [Acidimicrobiales bacterium]|nr:hypothetical protein [Acidimicrobiales bacterium]
MSRVFAAFRRPRCSQGHHRLRQYTLGHPVRGSLLSGLIWGTLIILLFSAATEFQDVGETLRVMLGAMALFAAFVLLETLCSRWKRGNTLKKNQPVG